MSELQAPKKMVPYVTAFIDACSRFELEVLNDLPDGDDVKQALDDGRAKSRVVFGQGGKYLIQFFATTDGVERLILNVHASSEATASGFR